MNDKPCGTCQYYDPIVVGDGSKNANRGWCAKKSLYPHKDQPGQKAPDGVQRVPQGTLLAVPVIVRGLRVQAHCTDHRAAPKT